LFNNFKSSPESEKVYELASNRYKNRNRSENDSSTGILAAKKVTNKPKVKKGKGYVNEFVEVKPPKRTSKRADTRRNVKYDRSEDAQILSSAINAKKRNSDSYRTKEDDTLFDILTKAYIRNYERIEN
jgi:ribosomal protein S8